MAPVVRESEFYRAYPILRHCRPSLSPSRTTRISYDLSLFGVTNLPGTAATLRHFSGNSSRRQKLNRTAAQNWHSPLARLNIPHALPNMRAVKLPVVYTTPGWTPRSGRALQRTLLRAIPSTYPAPPHMPGQGSLRIPAGRDGCPMPPATLSRLTRTRTGRLGYRYPAISHLYLHSSIPFHPPIPFRPPDISPASWRGSCCLPHRFLGR